MAVYPVLQSGFIGMTQEGLRRPDPIEATLRESVLLKDIKQPLSKYFYSPEVTELFARWCGDPKSLKDFDFREQILKAAIKAFSTISFYRWLELQNEKTTFSDLHKAFIMETLEYIFMYKERSIQPVQWLRLLEADDKSARVKVDLTKYYPHDNAGNAITGWDIPVKLEKVIASWVSLDNGFEDLLVCLMIIFGSRSQRTDVSKNS